MPDHSHHDHPTAEPHQHAAAPSLSHFFRTLRAYLPVIALALAAVAVGYVIIAVAMYILGPSQKVTTLAFRLEFEGADRGQYPNGTKFSSAEIISTAVLVKTFNDNDLKRFTSFPDFAKAVFVLESNAAHEALAREYQARLSDVRLTSVDRERIQREYELKLESLSKGQYSLNYLRKRDGDTIPETMVRKVLHDLLKNWVEFVSNEQHVLEYRVAMLSPDVVAGVAGDGTNPIIATAMLRARVLRVLENIDQLRALPSGELARTDKDALSLADISVRLVDLVRFRMEPLVNRIAAAGLDDRAETIRFLESQLSYDERRRESQVRTAETQQRTLAIYMNVQTDTSDLARVRPQPAQAGGESETVMPQLSETFIDRIMQLTANSASSEYRQHLADSYRTAALAIVPLEENVAYDRATLELVRGVHAGAPMTRDQVDQTIAETRAEVRDLVVKVHELYRKASSSLNPSTELLSTSAPYTRVERTRSLKDLVLGGILALAIALPLIVFVCLLHNRLREEEEAEGYAATEPAENGAG